MIQIFMKTYRWKLYPYSRSAKTFLQNAIKSSNNIVSIILHVSSIGTHNSAQILETDTDNTSLFKKKVPLHKGTSTYPHVN